MATINSHDRQQIQSLSQQRDATLQAAASAALELPVYVPGQFYVVQAAHAGGEVGQQSRSLANATARINATLKHLANTAAAGNGHVNGNFTKALDETATVIDELAGKK